MKRITLIHTVRSVLEDFESMLKNKCSEEINVSNIYDSFLADSPDELGFVSTACKRKLYQDVISAKENEPDIIAVTCSAMTETVRQIRPFIDIPIVAIDEEMIREAVRKGKRIRVLATAVSSAVTTKETLEKEAARSRKAVEVDATDNPAAFEALQQGNKELHDSLVKTQAKEIKGYDVIVLAQASMAHLEDTIADITKAKVLTSPSLCIKEICNLLEGIPNLRLVRNTLDHTAVYVRDIEWFTGFFEVVFGMKVKAYDQGEGGTPRQIWMDQGIQLIRCQEEYNTNDSILSHIAISVNGLEKILKKAYSYPEVTEMEQGRNWLRLPGNVVLEVLDE